MRKILMIVLMVTSAIVSSACDDRGSKGQEEVNETKSPSNSDAVQLIDVSANLREDSGWWIVSKNATDMTIYAEAQNADTVLFWFVPGGTDKWSERELLGSDTDSSDGWSFQWKFEKRSFHDYIHVQALGQDGLTQAGQTLNITTEN